MESIGYTRRYYEHNEDQESYTSRVGTEKQKEESANPEFSNIKNKKVERKLSQIKCTPKVR